MEGLENDGDRILTAPFLDSHMLSVGADPRFAMLPSRPWGPGWTVREWNDAQRRYELRLYERRTYGRFRNWWLRVCRRGSWRTPRPHRVTEIALSDTAAR